MSPRRASRIEASLKDGDDLTVANPRATKGFIAAAVVVVVILTTQLGIAVMGAIVGVRESENAAVETFSYVGDVTAERVARYAEAVRDVVDGTAVSLELSNGDMTQDELASQMHQRLVREPQVRAIYVGYPDGSYLEVRREGEGFVQERIAAEQAGQSTETHHSARFALVGDVEQVSTDYDPRYRPWYQVGENAVQTTWTPPFLLVDTGAPGAAATRSVRVDDQLVAVVGADLSLDTLAEILDQLPVGEGAQAFVMAPDRSIIAAPSQFDAEIFRLSAANGVVPRVDRLGISSDSSVLSHSQGTVITRQGEKYVLERAFAPEEQLNWILHLEADQHQLSPGLQRVQVTMAWVSGLSMLMVALAAALLYQLWQPLSQMRARASTDQLTGLVNRHDLETRGARMVESAHRSGHSVVVIVMDLDNFKLLNDTFGHHTGDLALKVTGTALVEGIRERDLAARLGGDEFVVVQRFPEPVDVPALAERTRAAVSQALSYEVEGGSAVGVTAGFSSSRGDEKSLEVLLNEADQALVHGKRRKKGRAYDYEDLVADDSDGERRIGPRSRRQPK